VLLSFRQKVESPGQSKRHFCAFDWPKRRTACLGLASFWRNDHTWNREADLTIEKKIAATTTACAVGTRASLRPFLSISFVHVTLRVTSSQHGKVAVGRPFVCQCQAELFDEFDVK